jgi:signal transduction histidine kinase
VDDDQLVRKILGKALVEQGHRVIAVDDGKQGLKVFQQNAPDLVILDAQMPEFNGFECCQTLRQISQNSFLPILMLTGLKDAESVERAFAAGVTDYITKPFNLAIFCQRIQQLLRSSRMMLNQQKHMLKLQAEVQELERLAQSKNEFFNTATHDLRLVLSNVRMSISMLTQTLAEMSEDFQLANQQKYLRSQTYLQILRDECNRGITLINNSLDLQRIEAINNPQALDFILLRNWLFHVSSPFTERVQQRQQTLKIQIETDLPAFTTSSIGLTRAMSELLNNACKYTPPGGEIVITVYATPDKLCLRISNSGVEIPSAETERIFDEFYQISGSDRWRQDGTGLGLTIVKRLISKLNGLIKVESESGWVHFTIELPL